MCSNFSRRGKRVEKFEGEERDLSGFCTELSFENSSFSLLFLGQKKTRSHRRLTQSLAAFRALEKKDF